MAAHPFQSGAAFFKFYTTPIRPHPDDVSIYREHLLSLKKPVRGILLGVTQELAQLACDQFDMTAIDISPDMVKHEWIGDSLNRRAKVANWFDLPKMVSNVDYILGDAVLNVLDRKSQHNLMESVRSILADDGILVLRLFIRPEVPETFEEIYKATTNNFSAFQIRFIHANCDSNFEIRRADIFKKYKELITDDDIAHFGWTKDALSTMDTFENSDYVMTFITESMFRDLCNEHRMEIIGRTTGSYELSERCPTFILRKI